MVLYDFKKNVGWKREVIKYFGGLGFVERNVLWETVFRRWGWRD